MLGTKLLIYHSPFVRLVEFNFHSVWLLHFIDIAERHSMHQKKNDKRTLKAEVAGVFLNYNLSVYLPSNLFHVQFLPLFFAMYIFSYIPLQFKTIMQNFISV